MKVLTLVRFSLKDALGVAFITEVLSSLLGFMFGFIIGNRYMMLALILTTVIVVFFQSCLYQIAVRATGQTLPAGKAYIISAVLYLSNFLVISPITALITGTFSK